jgi:hypothetical protein
MTSYTCYIKMMHFTDQMIDNELRGRFLAAVFPASPHSSKCEPDTHSNNTSLIKKNNYSFMNYWYITRLL